MKIFKVLNLDEIKNINQEIKRCAFKDGVFSAVGTAKLKKKNIEIGASDPNFTNILKKIYLVHENPTVKAYTYIKELIDPRIAKYSEGDEYDWHVDTALLANRRTDLSFTIFLNDQAEYDGGELEIINNSQKFIIKGLTGQMLIYPSGLLHKVNRITKGERLVIVGWINSHVKIEEYRLRLFDISSELSNLIIVHGIRSDNLDRIYYQLVRDYSS